MSARGAANDTPCSSQTVAGLLRPQRPDVRFAMFVARADPAVQGDHTVSVSRCFELRIVEIVRRLLEYPPRATVVLVFAGSTRTTISVLVNQVATRVRIGATADQRIPTQLIGLVRGVGTEVPLYAVCPDCTGRVTVLYADPALAASWHCVECVESYPAHAFH